VYGAGAASRDAIAALSGEEVLKEQRAFIEEWAATCAPLTLLFCTFPFFACLRRVVSLLSPHRLQATPRMAALLSPEAVKTVEGLEKVLRAATNEAHNPPGPRTECISQSGQCPPLHSAAQTGDVTSGRCRRAARP
jgi:hypothetical protein